MNDLHVYRSCNVKNRIDLYKFYISINFHLPSGRDEILILNPEIPVFENTGQWEY